MKSTILTVSCSTTASQRQLSATADSWLSNSKVTEVLSWRVGHRCPVSVELAEKKLTLSVLFSLCKPNPQTSIYCKVFRYREGWYNLSQHKDNREVHHNRSVTKSDTNENPTFFLISTFDVLNEWYHHLVPRYHLQLMKGTRTLWEVNYKVMLDATRQRMFFHLYTVNIIVTNWNDADDGFSFNLIFDPISKALLDAAICGFLQCTTLEYILIRAWKSFSSTPQEIGQHIYATS